MLYHNSGEKINCIRKTHLRYYVVHPAEVFVPAENNLLFPSNTENFWQGFFNEQSDY